LTGRHPGRAPTDPPAGYAEGRCDIDCVVLERQSRGYVEQRQRAGVLEYRASQMFDDWGLGRLLGNFPADDTLEIRVGGESHLVLNDPGGGRPGGEITDREVFGLRGLVCEPMSYGRLHLLGDAAHIIPPMGGKGMNLALHDAEVFARAAREFGELIAGLA
jgi:FAD binding domain